jgi:purine-binding chemotaxis protein CheW
MMDGITVLHAPRQLVVFRVGPTRYGVDVGEVDTIVIAQPVTPLAGAPAGVIGVVDVRKRVVPVFDLHWKFGVPQPEDWRSLRMVLVHHESGPVALLVGPVDEVATFARDAFQEVVPPGDRSGIAYVKGVAQREKDIVVWIDHRLVIPAGIAAQAA